MHRLEACLYNKKLGSAELPRTPPISPWISITPGSADLARNPPISSESAPPPTLGSADRPPESAESPGIREPCHVFVALFLLLNKTSDYCILGARTYA